MRLSEHEKNTIRQSVLALDKDAKVYLFGSRADDTKKGGDIDILVISEKLKYPDKLEIHSNFFMKLEEQKIDLIIVPKEKLDSPFVKLIYKKAIPL